MTSLLKGHEEKQKDRQDQVFRLILVLCDSLELLIPHLNPASLTDTKTKKNKIK